jgi:GntR family transcriptional repressor for pyruvate dehydrogenase complex
MSVIPAHRLGHDVFRPRKTATLLAQRIVSEIADRKLEPGTPLPPERVMLEEYGVARGTLREALRFLESQGVITMKTGPGGGPVVAQPTSRHLGSIIARMLQRAQTSFRSVLEARVTLEPTLARRAAERISDEELAELHESLVAMREHLDDVDFYLRENEHFHALIARAAGNPLFSLVIASLSWICDATPLGVGYPLESREAVCAEHARIYSAIAARDPDRAAAAMAVHMGDFSAYLERRYPHVMDAPVRWDQLDG